MRWDAYVLVSAHHENHVYEKAEEICKHISDLRDINILPEDPEYTDKEDGDILAHIGKPEGIEMKKEALKLNQDFEEEYGYSSGYYFYDMYGVEILDEDRIKKVKSQIPDAENLFIIKCRVNTF